VSQGLEDEAATNGFVAGILAALMHNSGALIWVSASRTIFPPALKAFGLAPEKIIFIDLPKEKEILWVMEEALKCKGLSAVVGEMQELNFTASRRLQLAVEQSSGTGFILRRKPKTLNTTACVTRWKISSLHSELPGGLPGVGFPRWRVELMKVRNGAPGNWEVEFVAGKFRHLSKITAIPYVSKLKTG
jgi:protein ImuA